jgi:hypothetical protein
VTYLEVAENGRGVECGTALVAQIPLEAPDEVLAILETLGRTEDVRFSPSGRRLAIACFLSGRIAFADVDVTTGAEGRRVEVSRVQQFESSFLDQPHGLDFVDEETVLVANRAGGIAAFRFPTAWPTGGVAEVEPLAPVTEAAADGPGSLLVQSPRAGMREVLACNNWADTVTRHTLNPDWTLGPEEVVVRKLLDLPDGLALSHDRRWLATSNHRSHCVLVHAFPTREDDDPVALLRGVRYPHGLRFTRDDRYLLVADAGSPHVHVFASSQLGWPGVRYPEAIISVMDVETFDRGHVNPEEGGPKGIDLHPATDVLAVTAERLPLAFFDVEAALRHTERTSADEVLLRYELDALGDRRGMRAANERLASDVTAVHHEVERARQETELWRAEAETRLRASSELREIYEGSASWQATRPFRAVKAALRRLDPR